MIFNRSDIYFAADDAHRFLPWLIGVMACLSALLLCLGVTMSGWIDLRHAHYSNNFTVNIPAHSEDTGKVRDALKKIPGVTFISEVTPESLQTMLKPWLGNHEAMEGLPLPTVLDVTLDGKTTPDYDKIEKTLSTIVPGVEVDAQERMVTAFTDFSLAAQCLASVLAFLILAAMSVMVAFTSTASLKLHAKTVSLLHAIGAEDDYITRQFQQEAFSLVLPGAALGCFAAAVIYWATGLYMSSLPLSLMPSLAIHFPHVALLLLMPLACALAAWMVARVCVMRELRRVL